MTFLALFFWNFRRNINNFAFDVIFLFWEGWSAIFRTTFKLILRGEVVFILYWDYPNNSPF